MFKCASGVILIFGLIATALANTTAQDFPQLKEYAKSLRGQTREALNHFHPETTFKDYNENPTQKQYYNGVETEKTDLSAASRQALKEDRGGQEVINHFGERQFEVNTQSTVIQQAKLIEEESFSITHGISNDRIHCDETPQECDLKTHDELCHTSRRLPDGQCSKKLKVEVNKEHINQHMNIEFTVKKKWEGYISVNLTTGAITNAVSGQVNSPVALKQPCDGLKATIHSIRNNGQAAPWVKVSTYPSCKNNGLLVLHLTQKWARYYPIQIRLTFDALSRAYVNEEHWDTDCGVLEGSGLCQVKKEQCTESNTTHVIEGLPVTRPCWAYDATYSCVSARADECVAQKNKGCLQSSSRCTLIENNACSLYEQVYRCQEKVCPKPIPCLKNLFCADGECTQNNATQNEDFGAAMAPLSVVGEAGREFGKTQATLFSGHQVTCKIWIFDLVDCCSKDGWLDKLHIDLCREEDKKLGRAKKDYLAHYVGEYCSEKILGVCTEYKNTYCVFDSKMARIVQEEGRLKQLNPNALGDAEHTTCPGLSVGELQRLDMGRINFLAPVYPYPHGSSMKEAGIVGDVSLNSPNPDKTMEEIKRRVQQRAAS
ncbi:type-F conjugative transfer system mating-pair stabilization protein TraN [Legionella santicrucis]|nr:type-F conjugative transfer system mating-pair stabilization protein TraN [Legionella santicrucis]